MAKKAEVPQAPAEVEALMRRLSSIEERLEGLKDLKEKVRNSIEESMERHSLKSAHAIYGTLTIREGNVFDFSGNPDVVEAQRKLEEAKVALKAAEEVAKAQLEPTRQTRVLAFNRNKAVSARARKGRIYVSTILRKGRVVR